MQAAKNRKIQRHPAKIDHPGAHFCRRRAKWAGFGMGLGEMKGVAAVVC